MEKIPLISATGVTKDYVIDGGTINILKGVSLGIMEGEILGVVGPSGAGKSTLLHILGLLETPTAGEIYFKGENVTKISQTKQAGIRNLSIGFVFQFHYLLPEFSALENVAMPSIIQGIKKKEAHERAKELLADVGLDNRIHHKPSELSGGEQQRTAICRAMMNQPQIIFADEPTGNLDTHNAERIHKIILDFQSKFNVSFLIVTHNKEMMEITGRNLTIVDGLIQE